MMTKDGLIFEANSLKQGRLQALTRQQLQAQATQNRERRCVATTSWNPALWGTPQPCRWPEYRHFGVRQLAVLTDQTLRSAERRGLETLAEETNSQRKQPGSEGGQDQLCSMPGRGGTARRVVRRARIIGYPRVGDEGRPYPIGPHARDQGAPEICLALRTSSMNSLR